MSPLLPRSASTDSFGCRVALEAKLMDRKKSMPSATKERWAAEQVRYAIIHLQQAKLVID